MKKSTAIFACCCLSNLLMGAEPPAQDRAAILAMAGSFVVDFHFQETVSFQAGYEAKPAYDAAATEWVVVVEDSPKKIVLQHILQTKRGIVKHWRQDWLYEHNTLWEFVGNNTWHKRTLAPKEVRGTWTQRVFQVDDSPRYESFGRWHHEGNLSEWEAAPTYRPVPRRDATKRDDYNVLVARNRHAVTLTGWVHEQDNMKLQLQGEERQYLVREIGLNRYDRGHENSCAEAEQWWHDHQPFWRTVRHAWDQVLADRNQLRLAKSRDDKPLYKHIFELGKQRMEASNRDTTEDCALILQTIQGFIISEDQQHAGLH